MYKPSPLQHASFVPPLNSPSFVQFTEVLRNYDNHLETARKVINQERENNQELQEVLEKAKVQNGELKSLLCKKDLLSTYLIPDRMSLVIFSQARF